MKSVLSFFCILAFGQFVFSQDDIQTPSGRPLPKSIEQVRNENLQNRMDNMRRLNNSRREMSLPRTKRLSKEERERVEEVKRVDDENREKYRNFLKQSNTGIFRLLPDFGCEEENLVRVDGECKNFVPGLWAYSFRLENYTNELFQDISFKKDKLVTNGLMSQGILVSIGDKALDSLSLNSDEIVLLADFEPAEDRKAAHQQYKDISQGVEKSGYIYANKLLMKENTTYALRIIAYDYKDKWRTRLWAKNIEKANEEERQFIGIDSDERSDSIYIFRITGKSEEDGGITILWKRLSKEKSPKIVYEEDERLKDFKTVD